MYFPDFLLMNSRKYKSQNSSFTFDILDISSRAFKHFS